MVYRAEELSFRGIDLNVLPERYRPRRISARQALMGLLVGIALVLPLPLYRLTNRNAIQTVLLRTALKHARAEARQPLLHMKEAQELRKGLAQVQAKAQAMDSGHRTLIARRRLWSDSLEVIIQTLPSRATLSSISQEGERLTIGGRVGSPTIAIDYAFALEETGAFSKVSIAQLVLVGNKERPSEAGFVIVVER